MAKEKLINPIQKNEIAQSLTRLIFKDQRLLDLWKNELLGQISDGAWENSKGTEWLWRNSSAKLGSENVVRVANQKINFL